MSDSNARWYDALCEAGDAASVPIQRRLLSDMKFSDRTIKGIAQYLPEKEGVGETPSPEPGREYTVEELALAANTTVRNIRAYQDKGLLPPPRLRGRKGIYSNLHLSRLQVIASLLDRGYTLSSIRELLEAVSQGIGLSEVLGIETALSSPWGNEEPVTVDMSELVRKFGSSLTPAALSKANELGLIKPEGSRMRVSSMQQLEVAEELCATGIPLEDLLDIQRMMRGNVQRVANEFVKLVADHVLSQYGGQNIPPKEELPKIAELIWRLRPLAEKAVDAELARAMGRAANEFLADQLEEIMAELGGGEDTS